jgi:hypothetical protein
VTVLPATPKITAVNIVGLEGLRLPFVPPVVGDMFDSTVLKPFLADYDAKYVVKSITGLEPPDRNVAIARTASGGKFQGVTTEDREIVVLIGLYPDWESGETPKILRDNLYTMLNTGYDPKVDIQLLSGILPYYHEYAYVTKFEASIFDANPAVQITFTTLNPTFRSYGIMKYNAEDLSESAPDIYNPGTAETGFQFAVKFTGAMSRWYIRTAEDQTIGMNFDMSFAANDVLAVSTIPGNKYIHWNKRRGKVYNKMGILTAVSEWIQLHPGHNHFIVPPNTDAWEWSGPFSFTVQYWGI